MGVTIGLSRSSYGPPTPPPDTASSSQAVTHNYRSNHVTHTIHLTAVPRVDYTHTANCFSRVQKPTGL